MYKSINYYKNFSDLLKNQINTESIYILFITETIEFNREELSKLDIKYYGAIFPKIIYNNQAYSKGILLIELNKNDRVIFYEDMDESSFCESEFETAKSIITIFDGLSSLATKFIENIFENIKLHTNILGGGSGCMQKNKRDTIFSNRGFFQNSALVVLLERKVEISVCHGWEYLEGPFIATKTGNNLIEEIDFDNAFENYKTIVEADCKEKLTKENFSEISIRYPLGIIKFNGESLIRDPFSFDEEGRLILAGDINCNAIFNILKGDKKALIEDISKASEKISANGCDEIFMFECVSRQQFLQESFDEEVEQILSNSNIKNIHGVFSIGELGNDANRYVYILNKSCVIGGMYVTE